MVFFPQFVATIALSVLRPRRSIDSLEMPYEVAFILEPNGHDFFDTKKSCGKRIDASPILSDFRYRTGDIPVSDLKR
jgi:hypothetical protein